MRMKKLLLFLLVLSMAMTVSLTGYGAKASAENKPVVLTVWSWDDTFNIPIIKKAGQVYAKNHPNVTVNAVALGKNDVYTKLQTGLAAGGKALPDIVLLEDYVSYKYLNNYSKHFADLSKSINYKDFLTFKKDAVTYKGKKYGVPLDAGPTSLFYRVDLLKKAGYTEADMQNLTWDKLIEIGQKVTKVTGVKWYLENASNRTSMIRLIMQSAGTWYFDKRGNVNIKNNAALKQAFQIIKKMIDSGIMYEAQDDNDYNSALNQGKVASIVVSPWIVSTIKAAKEQSGLWRVAPTPRLAKLKSKNASNVGGSAWYVMQNSPNKAVAIDLLKTAFDGNDQFYQDILVNQGCMFSYLPSLTDKVFDNGDPFFGGQKISQMFVNTMKQVQGFNYGGYVSEANDAVNTAIVGYLKGSASLNDAVNQADDQLRNQLQ